MVMWATPVKLSHHERDGKVESKRREERQYERETRGNVLLQCIHV